MLTHGLLIMKNLNEPDFLKVLSPYDQSLISKVSLCNLEQAEAMIEKASLLFKDRGKKLEHSERIAILRRLAQMVSDDEKELGINPIIASVSLGAERFFHLKHKKIKKERHKIKLAHGSLLIMGGEMQHYWQHQIAKTQKQIDPRINLTFRKIRA